MLKKLLAGFTLIELVMLIVIAGILVAFAIPRYADLGGDARRASVRRIGQDLKSAAAHVHAEAVAEGQDRAAATKVAFDHRSVAVRYGYPDVTSIRTAAGFSPAGRDYKEIADAGATPAAVTWNKQGGAPGACSVIYTEASPRGPATVTTSTSGC